MDIRKKMETEKNAFIIDKASRGLKWQPRLALYGRLYQIPTLFKESIAIKVFHMPEAMSTL